ncbi:acyltransferase [Bacteroides uniformis]|jgi:acetyltransferase-like isoleucine patch superfamily enzyme|uniref:Acyltransferase n=2 Tax=Bacteroidales TaxID=171549 RepID=A0AAW6G2N0_BACUN|nr:acyltransferase [Bacteroides uniformis]MDC1753711.1 acyltransferase [Bacteroides uniformis]MDC1970693.1 acyltransferase [Bacteroides uniformis]
MTFFKLFHSGIIHIRSFCYRLFWGHSFGSFGKGSIIVSPRIFNPKYIYIGKNCLINDKVWLASSGNGSKLIIGNRVRIGRFSEIFAIQSITIEEGVVMAENTYISDNTHSFDDVNIPIRDQEVIPLNNVVVGSGTWIGRNACIMGCKIGRNCVIGAFSFVKKDIPDYCVVVGNPARIVKRYNPQSGQWEKTDKDGNFILRKI